jgi:hypothetical protein
MAFSQDLVLLISGDSREAVEAIEKTKEAAEKTGEALHTVLEHGLIKAAEAGALAMAAITAVTGAIVGLGVHGSEVADVEEGFHRLAGGTEHATEVLGAMRAGVKGTIDDLKLMTDANHLLATGAVSSAADFGKLTEASRVLSREGFGSMEEMISGVSRAMETGRTRRLALMGVTVNQKEAEDALAKSLGLQASDLSTSQKLMADRRAVMEALTKTIEQAGEQELSFAERVSRAKVSMANWFDELAKGVATSPNVLRAFDAIQEAFVKAFGSDAQTLMETIIEWVNKFADAVTEYGPRFIEWLGEVKDAIFSAMETIKQEWDTIPQWMKNVGGDGAKAAVGVWALSGALGSLTGDGILGDLKALGASLAKVFEFLSAVRILGITGALQYMVPWINKAVVAWTAYAATLGTAGEAATLAATSFAAIAIPIAAATAVIIAGYNAWKLWNESADRDAADARQRTVDQTNLARINKALGTSYTNLADAVKAANEQHAKLAGTHKNTIEETRELALASDVAKRKITDLGEAQRIVLAEASKDAGREITNLGEAMVIVTAKANAADEKVTKFGKAVEAFVTSLRGQGKSVDVVVAGFNSLTAAEKQNADVIDALLPTVNKFIATHKKIPEALKEWRDTSIAAKEQLDQENLAMLLADKTTKENIATMRARNESEAQIAEALGVTAGALRRYGQVETAINQNSAENLKFLQDRAAQTSAAVKKTHDDFINGSARNTAQSETLWTEYFNLIDKRTLSSFDYQREEVDNWVKTQRDSINYGTKNWYDSWQAIDAVAKEKLKDIRIAEKDQLAQMHLQEITWSNEFKKTVGGLPELLKSAFAGGGGAAGAVKGMLSGIGGDIGKKLFEGPTGMGQKVAGGVLGMLGMGGKAGMAGLLGTAVGGFATMGLSLAAPLVMKGVSALMHIGKASKMEVEGRKAEGDFEKQFGSFDAMMKAIGTSYEATGKSSADAQADVKRLMDAEKKGGDAVKGVIADIQKQMDLQKKASEDLPKELTKVASGFSAIGVGLFADSFKAFEKFKASLKPDQFKDDPEGLSRAFQAGFTIPTQAALDRTGRLAKSAFSAALAGGQSFLQALDGIGPGLDAINQGLDTFGGMTMSPEYWGIANLRKFEEGHKELLGTLDGVNQMMEGLHNMGLMTQQDFSDLQGVATDAYNQMIAGGIDSETALRAMQPTLQKTWEMEHDYGMAVDDSTQALLDQAEQQGIVGEKMKTVQQQTLDVLKAIAKVLGADIPGALAKIPDKKTVNIDFNATQSGDWPSGEGMPGAETTPDGVPSFAGRSLERVTGTGYALLHPGDVVGVPKPGMFGASAGAIAAVAGQRRRPPHDDAEHAGHLRAEGARRGPDGQLTTRGAHGHPDTPIRLCRGRRAVSDPGQPLQLERAAQLHRRQQRVAAGAQHVGRVVVGGHRVGEPVGGGEHHPDGAGVERDAGVEHGRVARDGGGR